MLIILTTLFCCQTSLSMTGEGKKSYRCSRGAARFLASRNLLTMNRNPPHMHMYNKYSNTSWQFFFKQQLWWLWPWKSGCINSIDVFAKGLIDNLITLRTRRLRKPDQSKLNSGKVGFFAKPSQVICMPNFSLNGWFGPGLGSVTT